MVSSQARLLVYRVQGGSRPPDEGDGVARWPFEQSSGSVRVLFPTSRPASPVSRADSIHVPDLSNRVFTSNPSTSSARNEFNVSTPEHGSKSLQTRLRRPVRVVASRKGPATAPRRLTSGKRGGSIVSLRIKNGSTTSRRSTRDSRFEVESMISQNGVSPVLSPSLCHLF